MYPSTGLTTQVLSKKTDHSGLPQIGMPIRIAFFSVRTLKLSKIHYLAKSLPLRSLRTCVIKIVQM